MDLAGMLNDSDAPPKKTSNSQPPSQTPTSQTPLYTPSHAPQGSGQYPFPQQQPPPLQHPGHQQQPYRGYEPYSATSPGARPPSHGYAQPSPSLSQYQSHQGMPHNASLSPTPPSHASHTPHSLRQSPMATIGHPPPPPPHYQQSQPHTPLGPPQLPKRHSSQQLDLSTLNHQRAYSGASSSITSGSPAQHHPSIGNLLDSSAPYPPSQSQPRTNSNSIERERSESVSPKTVVQPRLSNQPSTTAHESSPAPLFGSANQAQGYSSDQHKEGLLLKSFTPPAIKDTEPAPVKPEPHRIEPHTDNMAPTANKRPASDDLTSERPAKRERVRKYRERPIWAQLSPENPRYNASDAPNRAPKVEQPPRPHQTHLNGSREVPPWQRDPPVDADLVHARKILGDWEKSLKWNVTVPTFNRAIADWLFQQLEAYAGLSSPDATIEIEAKIGTLTDENGYRCALPVRNTCVLDATTNKRFHFQSEMNEIEHKNMNEFLNGALQDAYNKKGRSPVTYVHIREIDTFRVLNEAGISTLPPAAAKRRGNRQLSMRTSTDTQTGQVTARIVKVKLGEDLHIFGATDPYDVRVSMNLEVNLDKPGFDADFMTANPADQPGQPGRRKDRMSYKHLETYTVDLTRVDPVATNESERKPAKYELELEMDSKKLIDQYEALKQQRPNAYFNLVDGFVDNMMFLVKQNRK